MCIRDIAVVLSSHHSLAVAQASPEISAIDQDAVELFAAEDPGVEGAAAISDQRTAAIEEMEKMRY